jgi:hypothetical protein
VKKIIVGRDATIVLVDDDFHLPPEGFSLSINNLGYVRMMRCTGERRSGGSYIYEQDYLHRYITQTPKDKVVLFLDHDRLNLQKANLLVCERAISIRNTGGRKGRFKGVHFSKKQMKWVAQITFNYKCYSLGAFDSEEHAATVYNAAAVRLYGEHAYINVMPEDGRGF